MDSTLDCESGCLGLIHGDNRTVVAVYRIDKPPSAHDIVSRILMFTLLFIEWEIYQLLVEMIIVLALSQERVVMLKLLVYKSS